MSKEYSELLDRRRSDYRTWSPIYCSAVNEQVFFSANGFNHLRFNTDNSPRSPREAMYKLGLLPLVRPVIYAATRVQKYERRFSPVGGSTKKIIKEIEYWALEAIVGKQNTKIRVILRRIVGSNRIQFWSVMKLGENQKTPPAGEVS